MMPALRLTLLLTALGSAVPVHGEIYRWVDENGLVHFDERPQGRGATLVDITPAPPPDPAIRQRQQRTHRLLQVIAEERSEQREAAAKAATERKERHQACASARKHLSEFESSRRLYTQDDSGARNYLDDQARDNAIAAARKQVKQLCS